MENIKESFLRISPVPCDFKVGDKVDYTNVYGVTFEGREIIGFSSPGHDLFKHGKFIHLDHDCYWMPVNPASLNLQVQGDPSSNKKEAYLTRDITLNNGQIAKYTHTDFWCRPNYVLENDTKVCCVELNGTLLTTMTGYGEPCSPLNHEYQPMSTPSQ